ncbi:hypothetical protein B0H17DRAFT_1147285 [Mycena rosella]|uniref:Uncharacterized protein n=1 Tax=Mycena rosella TaxID=1033263 RepID=A0AAD7CMQ3_MYCRO|nr:hypothetical protein B0H17DRAFT_1147285 [Mycena rosella]
MSTSTSPAMQQTFSRVRSVFTGAPESPPSSVGRPNPMKTRYATDPSMRDEEMVPHTTHPGSGLGPINSDEARMTETSLSTAEISQGRMGARCQTFIEEELASKRSRHRSDGVPGKRPEEGESRLKRETMARKASQVKHLERENTELKGSVERLQAEISRMEQTNRQHKLARRKAIEEEQAAIQGFAGNGSRQPVRQRARWHMSPNLGARYPASGDRIWGSWGITPVPGGQISWVSTGPNLASTADVRRIMEDWNEEIFQTAAALADLGFRAKTTKTYGTPCQGPDSEVRVHMAPALGSELVGLLSSSRGYQPAPEIVVQMALQSAISAWSYRKIQSWTLDKSEEPNRFLTDLYTGVCHSEDPKDAARWLSITGKQLVQRASSSDLRISLLQDILDVLFSARADKSEGPNHKTVEMEIGDRVAVVARLVLDLNWAIGTQIVSDVLEAVFIEPGARFEPKTMENM